MEKSATVLQGRFEAILVERDSYLLELCRYIVLNPVRARITRKPDCYGRSSYRASAGLEPVPGFLMVDWLLSQFGGQRAAAQRRYQTFVAEGIGQTSPWEKVQGQVLLGGKAFVERLQPGLRGSRSIREIPRRQRFAARPALATLFRSRVLADLRQRNAVIRRVSAREVRWSYAVGSL